MATGPRWRPDHVRDFLVVFVQISDHFYAKFRGPLDMTVTVTEYLMVTLTSQRSLIELGEQMTPVVQKNLH